MKIQEETFRIRCNCGRPARAGVLRGGGRLGTLVFFDEKSGAAHADRITCCSGCGRRLDLLAILQQSG